MCQCGCGDNPHDWKFQVRRGVTLAVGTYRGCDYCDTGLAVEIGLFTPKGKEWYRYLEDCGAFTPNEYGGQVEGWGGPGLIIPVVGKDDLIAAAKLMEKEDGVPLTFSGDEDDYTSITEWLEEFGLELLQKAHRLRMKEWGSPKVKG